MNADDVLERTIDALALVVDADPASLLQDLEASGEGWPFDSIVLAEVLVVLEAELAISVPMDMRTARALRSVTGLVERVSEVAGGAAG